LIDYCVGEKGGTAEEDNCAKFHILFRVHFAKYSGKQTSQSKVQENRQEGVGVVVKINILAGPQTVLLKDVKTHEADYHTRGHINIQEGIFAEGAAPDGAHYHGRFQERTEGPNYIFD